MTTSQIAVRSGTGTTGRRIVTRLSELSIPVRSGSRSGAPPFDWAVETRLFTKVLDGRNSHLTGDLEEILGRPARDFRDYADRTAAAGAWAV